MEENIITTKHPWCLEEVDPNIKEYVLLGEII
jgi:hypothetical protein